jgi:hypothetical protein
LTFPSALDLLPDGLDPFDQTSVSSPSSPVSLSSGPSPAQTGWFNRPATTSLQAAAPLTAPVAFAGVSVAASGQDSVGLVPPVGQLSPVCTAGTLRLSQGQSPFANASTTAPPQATAEPTAGQTAMAPAPATTMPPTTPPTMPLTAPVTLSAPFTGTNAAFPFPAPGPPGLDLKNPLVSAAAEMIGQPPQPPQPPSVGTVPQRDPWVPPAAPVEETVEPAKPSPSHHPLRSRVRSGL